MRLKLTLLSVLICLSFPATSEDLNPNDLKKIDHKRVEFKPQAPSLLRMFIFGSAGILTFHFFKEQILRVVHHHHQVRAH